MSIIIPHESTSQTILLEKEDFIKSIENFYVGRLRRIFQNRNIPNKTLIQHISQDLTIIVMKTLFGLIPTYHTRDRNRRSIEIQRGKMDSASGSIDAYHVNRNIVRCIRNKDYSIMDACINYDDFRNYARDFLINKYHSLKIFLELREAVESSFISMGNLNGFVINLFDCNKFNEDRKGILENIFPNVDLKTIDASQRKELFDEYMCNWFLEKKLEEEDNKYKTVAKHNGKNKIKI